MCIRDRSASLPISLGTRRIEQTDPMARRVQQLAPGARIRTGRFQAGMNWPMGSMSVQPGQEFFIAGASIFKRLFQAAAVGLEQTHVRFAFGDIQSDKQSIERSIHRHWFFGAVPMSLRNPGFRQTCMRARPILKQAAQDKVRLKAERRGSRANLPTGFVGALGRVRSSALTSSKLGYNSTEPNKKVLKGKIQGRVAPRAPPILPEALKCHS